MSYRDLSLWHEQSGDDLTPRPPLDGDVEVDVAIVGGGYTGLWTAFYLAIADPGLRIAVIEKEICGFGASGRNGGWCSALFAAGRPTIAKLYGRSAALDLQRALFATVDEVGAVAAAEGIDCHFHKGGTLSFVTAPGQAERVREEVETERSWGFSEEDYRWLDTTEAAARVNVNGCLGAVYTPHCARIQPARLARGLASAVAKRGVAVYESTAALELGDRVVRTDRGTVRADVVVRALEGYTPMLPRLRRRLLPLYSLMIATEPLPPSFWDEVGWSGLETITDGRNLLIYAQRTADDRIAFGGRGAPYHYGSRVRPEFDRDTGVFAELQKVLVELFPGAADAHITHRWGGPLAAPRDWFSSVGFDRDSSLAWAGGYVGDGVATSNLAGRTLADLITGAESDLTRLPWVGHKWRDWELEPLRWMGINLALHTMARADAIEARTGRPARRVAIIDRLLGR